jgi:hypothetical protein
VSRLPTLIASHADDIEAVAAKLEKDLESLLTQAGEYLRQQLSDTLRTTVAGTVAATSGNLKVLSNLDSMVWKYLQENGYPKIIQEYQDSFNGQYVAFENVLKAINEELSWPLPTPSIDPKGLQLKAAQIQQAALIDSVVEQSLSRAKRTSLEQIGAVNAKQLAEAIQSQLHKSVAQAQAIADTGLSSFYRAITDKGYQIIEDDLPEMKIRYVYEGPLDVLTRPFCTKLQRQSNSGKSWTRQQINAMDNGQLPNVWLTAGGYRCRHQWIIDTTDLKSQQGDKPVRRQSSSGSKRQRSSAIAEETRSRRIINQDRIKRTPKLDSSQQRELAQQRIKDKKDQRGKK